MNIDTQFHCQACGHLIATLAQTDAGTVAAPGDTGKFTMREDKSLSTPTTFALILECPKCGADTPGWRQGRTPMPPVPKLG